MSDYLMFCGCGYAQALWLLAQSRTHASSLAVPLQIRFAIYDKPSAAYYALVEKVERLSVNLRYITL